MATPESTRSAPAGCAGAVPGPAAAGMVEVLERWLQSPLGASQCCRSTGAVPIIDAIGMCAELLELSGGSIGRVADAIRAGPPHAPIAVDMATKAVRLRSMSERVRSAAESRVLEAPSRSASLLDLLDGGALGQLLAGVPEASERLQVLRHALGASELVEVSASRATAKAPQPGEGAQPRGLLLSPPPSAGREGDLSADALDELDAAGSTPDSAFRTPSPGSDRREAASDTPPSAAAPPSASAPPSAAVSRGAAAAAAAPLRADAPDWLPGAATGPLGPACGGPGGDGQMVWCPLLPTVCAASPARGGGAADADEDRGKADAAADYVPVYSMLPPGYSMFPALGPSPRARSASSPEGSGGEWAGAGGQPDAEPGAAQPPASEATEAAVAGLPGEGQWVWFPAGGDAPRAEWGGECQGDWPPARHSRRRSGLRAKTREWYPNRSSKLTSRVVAVLESAPPRLAHSTAPDGWVPINAVFAADTELAELCYGNPQQLVLAIRKCPESCHYLVADRDREAVRLLSGAERICMLCETYVLERVKWVPGPAPFLELLQHPPVQSLLATVGEGAATPSDSDYDASVGIVHDALADSTLLELVADESGEWSVALLPLWRPLRVVLEHILESDKKILSTLQREGEVSLAYLAETPAVRKMLKRLELNDTHSALSCLRDATQELKGAQLDASGMSLVPLEAIPDVGLKAWEKRRRERPSRSSWSKWHPEEKDVKKLRDLFTFYFDAFNLQHNKVLMARVEAVREMDAWRAKNPKSRGTRPFFRVSDMQALPRIAAVLNSYDQEGLGWLLEAVFQSSDSLPVRLSWKQGRQSREQPVLELSYTPCFRYFDFVERSPETEFLLDPEPIAGPSSQLAPSHVVCAISYSVSSDLSHAQSPKVTDIQEQIMNGQVDSGVLAWEERQRKLVRQLKLHGADVICIQGVQSIGFKERSSEKDPEWFACDDEPATNHLVHLYRDMNRSNYSVVFSPTMHMPSSSALCLGNAIFWKRNRWHAERVWAITQTAVVVELVSKTECPPLTVCSYKPPEVWAQDWGEELLVADLLKPAERVRAALDPAVAERGSRLLWCGDFGLEPRELLPPLVQQAPPHGDPPEVGTVRSACESVVGWSPWTSACKHSEGKATDLILYDHGLRALAALGGLPDRMDLAKLLRAGNPSDHLVQVAAFSCAGGGRGAHSRCAQEEAPAEAALQGRWPDLQGRAGAAFQ